MIISDTAIKNRISVVVLAELQLLPDKVRTILARADELEAPAPDQPCVPVVCVKIDIFLISPAG